MTLTIDRLRGIALTAIVVLAPALAAAQDSKSATSVVEFVKLLDQMKLDSFAVKGAAPDEYVGALYFPGSQLLVVSAKIQGTYRGAQLIAEKNYRDIYIDLNSASVPATKVFVSDLGADGLRYKKSDNQAFDTVDVGGKTYNFDGDWKKANLSEDDYTKAYSTSDDRYMQMIQTLLAALKKPP